MLKGGRFTPIPGGGGGGGGGGGVYLPLPPKFYHKIGTAIDFPQNVSLLIFMDN